MSGMPVGIDGAGWGGIDRDKRPDTRKPARGGLLEVIHRLL